MPLSLRRGALISLAATAAAASSCTLFVDASDLSGGAEVIDAAVLTPTSDGSVVMTVDAADAALEADAADAAVEADAGPRKNACGALLFGTPEPLFNGGFELGCASGWTTFEATVTEDTSKPASGSIACRLCFQAGPDGFFLNQEVAKSVLPGEIYELVACVRGEPGSDGGLMPFGEFSAGIDGLRGAGVSAGESYTPVRVAWEIPVAHPSLSVRVRAYPPPDACFYVDDVSLSRIRDAGGD